MGEKVAEASAVPRADALCTAQGSANSFLGCPAEPGPDIHQEGMLGDSLGEKTPPVHLPHGAETLDAHMSVLHWHLYLQEGCPPPQTPPTALSGPRPALCAPLSTHSFSPSPSLHPCPPILTSFLWGGGLSSYRGAGGPPVRLSQNAKCPRSSLGGSVPAQPPPSPLHLRLRTITELPATSPSPSTSAGGGSCHPQTAPKRVQPPCIPWEPLQGAGRG